MGERKRFRNPVAAGVMIACPHFSHPGWTCYIERGDVPEVRPCDGTHECLDVERKVMERSIFVLGLWLGYLSHLLEDEDCLRTVARFYNIYIYELWARINKEISRIKKSPRAGGEVEQEQAGKRDGLQPVSAF